MNNYENYLVLNRKTNKCLEIYVNWKIFLKKLEEASSDCDGFIPNPIKSIISHILVHKKDWINGTNNFKTYKVLDKNWMKLIFNLENDKENYPNINLTFDNLMKVVYQEPKCMGFFKTMEKERYMMNKIYEQLKEQV